MTGEKKKMKIFAVSDVHSFYSELVRALKEAGYDRDNEEHLLVMCGDFFDRGGEPLEMLEFLEGLNPDRVVLLRGNHDDMMEDALIDGRIQSVHERNGTEKTLSTLFGLSPFYLDSALRRSAFSPMGKRLRRLICRMQDMLETDNYIFVHGWLPLKGIGRFARLVPDPVHATHAEWRTARWTEWMEAYRNGLTVKGKTVVCGHRACAYASTIVQGRDRQDSSIFFGDGVCAIDALTVVSGRVNVLVAEDFVTVSRTHEMSLVDEMYEEIRIGEKRVEMRLFDEKRKNLRLGDVIVFSNADRPDAPTIETKVTSLHVYPSFAALAKEFAPAGLGFDATHTAEDIAAYMERIYGDRCRSEKAIAIGIAHRRAVCGEICPSGK